MSCTKKQKIGSNIATSAPPGYHYEGEYCTLYEGKPTRRLRKDIDGSREEKYKDLYCRLDVPVEGGLAGVVFPKLSEQQALSHFYPLLPVTNPENDVESPMTTQIQKRVILSQDLTFTVQFCL